MSSACNDVGLWSGGLWSLLCKELSASFTVSLSIKGIIWRNAKSGIIRKNNNNILMLLP